MSRVKDAMRKFDMQFEGYTDDKLINMAFSDTDISHMDRMDMMNMIEEFGRRYQNLLSIIQALDEQDK